ncbi:MAG: glycoside hydrolase family 9 protein, partial [Bacteroidales bacterium]|nr:glycoside hydrolase family 9 protein [Bacteroidales bacterium]
MNKKFSILVILAVFLGITSVDGKVTLKEIHTASNDVLVAFFVGDTLDVNEISIDDVSQWKINGKPAVAVYKYATEGDKCDHHIYLKTNKLEEGKKYNIETPYGSKKISFKAAGILCESIKTNQVGYSALSKTRYANFAIWLGTGGSQKIEGGLPEYEVIGTKNNKAVASGKLVEIGEDEGSGDFVYRINLSEVPEGGPYKVVIEGYGSSYPFGVGGEFSKYLAYTIFRAQYLQRCGCPIDIPDIRKDPCHTLIYDVDGPIGEANIDVAGDEPTFTMYGGYHDAGDADRRAYHMSNPIINLMIWEAFPEYFTDGQYDVPGEFTNDFHIKSYTNDIPDIIDEAEWGTLAWEYLQNEDGNIQWGTETRGYPDPFAAPLDLDNKKYGTVKTDPRATCTGAGLFMHLARIIKPYDAEHSASLVEKAELSMKAASEFMADPERLY